MTEQRLTKKEQRTAKKRKRGGGRSERNAPDDAAAVTQHDASTVEPCAAAVDLRALAGSPACDVAEPQIKSLRRPEESRGLICSRCGCCQFRVIYTRAIVGGVIRRRRECRYCGRRVTTKEAVLG